MADSSGSPERRTFLKIGAGVVGGLVVGAGVAYLAKPSTTATTTSVSTETMSGSNTTETSTSTVTGPVTTTTTTATVTGPTTTSTVTGPTSTTTVTGQGTTSTVTNTTTATTTATSTVVCTGGITNLTAFLVLNPTEALEVTALAENMVPSDSNGPGCKEAGCVYFIDSQLAGGNYGFNAKMYMQGPFVQPNQTGSLTVKALNGQMITYTGGSPTEYRGNPYYYQHPFQYRELWEAGLAALEVYSNSAYGGNFETLSAANQTQVIADCWANKPTNFTVPTAEDFISEVQEMVWAGFVTDPIHGGNKGMVGWTYVGYNGQNEGNFYNCGYTTKQLMVMSTPVVLKPASLGQLQAAT
jgi:gluconate 2-dehydrogenase gamma chain